MADDDCLDVSIHRRAAVSPGFHLEHILELNTLARFFTDVMQGGFPSTRTMRTAPISQSLVRQTLGTRYQHMVPPFIPGIQNSDVPRVRLFNALGSETNTQHFVIIQAGVNQAKSVMSTAFQKLQYRSEEIVITDSNSLAGVATSIRWRRVRSLGV